MDQTTLTDIKIMKGYFMCLQLKFNASLQPQTHNTVVAYLQLATPMNQICQTARNEQTYRVFN